MPVPEAVEATKEDGGRGTKRKVETDSEDDDEDENYRPKSAQRRRPPPPPPSKESPFYNHVRFSPTVKPGSPSSRQMRSVERRSKLSRVRLHNVPSEDEQNEFKRRYSKDLRSRRRRMDMGGADPDEGGEKEEEAPRRSARERHHVPVIEHSSCTEETEEEDEREVEQVKAVAATSTVTPSLRSSSRRGLVQHTEPPPRSSTLSKSASTKNDEDANVVAGVEDVDEAGRSVRRSSRILHKPEPANGHSGVEQSSMSEEEEDDGDAHEVDEDGKFNARYI